MISQRQHLLIAAMVWTMAAMMLILRGSVWIVSHAHTHHYIIFGFSMVIVLGVLKGQLLLSRTASSMIGHIRCLDERSPFWKVYAPPMYLTVVTMVAFGIICRWIGAHWHIYWIIGYLYSAIGIALFTSSASFWRAWRTEQAAG